MAFIAKIKDKIEEVINPDAFKQEKVSLTEGNEMLLPKVKFRRDESDRILKVKRFGWEKNLKFFDGDHWQIANVSLPTYKANIVINKFFAAVRSLVAFETDSKPDPQVEARAEVSDREEVIAKAKKVEAALDYRWDIRQIPSILTEIYYDRYIFDDGFGMYFWNSEIDDFDFEQIKPQELMIAPGATCIEDAEYLIVQKLRNRKWFETFYPDAKIRYQEARKEQPDLYGTKKDYRNMAKVYHYFEDEIWITFTDDEVLDKKRNPHWEWRSEADQIKELGGRKKVPIGWEPIKNHLIKPEKPIVHFKGYHLGGEFYSRSVVKQVFKIAMNINKRKCQISDNADAVGNARIFIDPSIPLSKANLITSEPGIKIRVNPNLVRVEPGVPLPEHVFEDLLHSERKFDDMMGHHEISRGAQATKRQTAREAMLLRETDITPVRLLIRNSEVAITKLLNGWVQLMKLFYNNQHYIGKTAATAGTFITRNDIPDDLFISIKVGSTLPVSREVKREEYKSDFAAGAIDLQSYLEFMDYPNPEKIVERVMQQAQGAQEAAAAK